MGGILAGASGADGVFGAFAHDSAIAGVLVLQRQEIRSVPSSN